MPLVVTDDGAAGSKNRRSTHSRSTAFPKTLRRSQTLNEETHSSSGRSKPTIRYASQSLEDLVRCAICLEQLRRPTMLPCQHTFCLNCLERCVEKRENSLITCPTCRLQVTVPAEGISALPTNILLQAFLESLQSEKSHQPAGLNDSAPVQRAICYRCSGPDDNRIACDHCHQLFCRSCHLVHTTEMKEKWSELIDDLFGENQRLSMIKEAHKARFKKLRGNIEAAVAIQMNQLMEKQDQLLAELKEWKKKELDRVIQVQGLCEEILVETPSIGALVEEPMPNADVLKRSEAILQTARLCGTSRLMFDSEELSLTCQSSENDNSTASVVHHASPRELATTTTTHAARRSRRSVTFNEFANSGDHPDSPTTTAGESAKKPGGVDVSASAAEEQSLHYRSLSGNPRQRITSSLLQRPAGVAVSPWTGDIYVAATDSHRVYVIDRNGKIVKSLGSPYRSQDCQRGVTGPWNHGTPALPNATNCGTFLCPFGIAFSTVAEEIYITDKWLNCIQVFNKDGVYQRQIGVKGTSPGHFRSPEGIAVDCKGLIYVCDTCNDRVQVLDRNGVYIGELGAISQMTLLNGKSYQKKEFCEPSGVAVSPDGSRIAVCDFGNCRIKVFTPNGELIVVFGFRGTQRGQFQQPECLAIDEKGFILVGDNGNGRIQIFRPNGNFVRAFGSKGSGPGQFNWISGLTLSQDMDIIATDFKNHCVQIF